MVAEGATQKAINNDALQKLQIPIPPLNIQQRVVAILEPADRLRLMRSQANQLANKIIQSFFYEMFGGPSFKQKSWASENDPRSFGTY